MASKASQRREFVGLKELEAHEKKLAKFDAEHPFSGKYATHFKAIFEIIGHTLRRAIANDEHLQKRIGELEQRLEKAESDTRYRGVWQSSEQYKRGDWSTHSGGLWHCNDLCSGQRPGDGSRFWKLMVKSSK